MKKVWNLLVTLLVIVGVMAVAFSVIIWKSSSTIKDLPSEEVATYIGEHSVLYVQTGCIHCKEQEDLFGVNVKYLNIVDCVSSPENTQACINADITATPTWIINGQKYTGVQTVDKLKELTGYQG